MAKNGNKLKWLKVPTGYEILSISKQLLLIQIILEAILKYLINKPIDPTREYVSYVTTEALLRIMSSVVA